MTASQKIIDKIKKLGNTDYPDSEIFLYGSRARGDAGIESDWDLLILLKEKNISFERETAIMDDFYELELETGQIFSPMIFSKYDWKNKYFITPLYQNIDKDGIQLV
jgi:predicted nucleotidyltransferase